MKGQIREHKIEPVEPGKEVCYKRKINKQWRGPTKVIGRYEKTSVVKHGHTLSDFARMHITRLVEIPQDREHLKLENNNNDKI